MQGYSTVAVKAASAVDSVEGVGAQSGGDVSSRCPDGTVVVGMAAGAQPTYVSWRLQKTTSLAAKWHRQCHTKWPESGTEALCL
jgi:hypothetical protein